MSQCFDHVEIRRFSAPSALKIQPEKVKIKITENKIKRNKGKYIPMRWCERKRKEKKRKITST